MVPITPIGGAGEPARSIPPSATELVPATGGAGQPNAPTTLAAPSVAIQSTQTTVSAMMSRVDTFMTQVGGDLRDNDLLKLIIGLLILELLLGRGSESNRAQQERLGLLSQLAAGSESSSLFLLESSTTVMQVDYASSVMTGTAGPSLASMTGPADASGQRLDLSV